MSIVRQLVELHGGNVAVESQGKGARLHVLRAPTERAGRASSMRRRRDAVPHCTVSWERPEPTS